MFYPFRYERGRRSNDNTPLHTLFIRLSYSFILYYCLTCICSLYSILPACKWLAPFAADVLILLVSSAHEARRFCWAHCPIHTTQRDAINSSCRVGRCSLHNRNCQTAPVHRIKQYLGLAIQKSTNIMMQHSNGKNTVS